MSKILSCAVLDGKSIEASAKNYVVARAEFDASFIQLSEEGFADKMAHFFSLYTLEGFKEVKRDDNMYSTLVKSYSKIVQREIKKADLSTKTGVKQLLALVSNYNSKAKNYRSALNEIYAEANRLNQKDGDKAAKWGMFYSHIKAIADGIMNTLGLLPGASTGISMSYGIIQDVGTQFVDYKIRGTANTDAAELIVLKHGAKMALSVGKHYIEKKVPNGKVIKGLIEGHEYFIDTILLNLEFNENKKNFN